MSREVLRDPREVLARQKHFNLRPRPLEQWLWRQAIAPSAERVFWLHWQEGMRSGDWCSCIPLKRVATLCALDVSSVTRAYQSLGRLGLLRRQDPGRDPRRPFEQAVAVTEVRVPRELVQELDRHPDRARSGDTASSDAGIAASGSVAREPDPVAPGEDAPRDPFQGLSGRERLRTLAGLLSRMSPVERRQYDDALRTHRASLTFDADCALSAEERGQVLQFLQRAAPAPLPPSQTAKGLPHAAPAIGPRRLSVFQLARLRRDLHALSGVERGAELLREVVWSVEQGALRRFTALHALRIALKKIREQAWTRPHRMPPNWSRELSVPPGQGTDGIFAGTGACRFA